MADQAEASVEYKYNAILGEGPVWDDQESKLYWVDILSGTLFCYDPDTKHQRSYNMDEHLGAIALREQGGLIVAKQTGFVFYNTGTGKQTPIADPESHVPDNRFNDGKCDPSGRFRAGTMSYVQKRGRGSLYCLDHRLGVDRKLNDLTISNGMAWNGQGTKFYFIDTPTRNIVRFDYDDGSGEIANPSIIRTIDKGDGFPDGMTIDREDKLWVALYDGAKVIRVDPADGNTLFEVDLPVPKVTCCTFGGRALNELYITTARENMSEQEIDEYPLSGSLFKAQLPFVGRPADRFQG